MSLVREPGEEPLPGYRLIAPLGSGGFGEAWKCEAPGGIFKAIKFVFGNLNSMDVDGARADQELKALNRVKEIRHPFILSMDLIKIVEGELVIVMELADKSLYDAAQESLAAGLVGIPRDALLGYVRDAAEALDHMNEKHGLQHLDIKPRNLFLISNRVKVADFGLVKHLERSGLSGVLGGVTPLYAPPETFTGQISGSSDQYSLAIVYQELLTGQRPFAGKNPRQLAQQHMEEEPDLRSVPEAERPVIARALAKDPDRRFPNCLAFVRALYNARPSAKPGARAPGDPQRAGTIYDTMEDILLEHRPSDDDNVALGAPQPEEAGAPDGDLDNAELVSSLGMTMALPQTGSLRPTVVIGVGSFGRRALVELRCRFLDRFGDLDKMPLVKFLYVDIDAEAVRAARRGSPEVAFKDGETYHLPLQPISHYRRRQLEHLNEWLPREKLFALPRSLKTQGSRALGRLAFADNYLRVAAKLKKAIQEVTHPDALYKAVSETGLALRDNVPRVYVVAGAGGGSSGLLPDLGFTVRRLLQQMRHPDAPLTCLLFCGAPEDPATPRGEQANLYATLTELNHFADPAVPFAAQYGTDGPRLVQEGPAYDHTYLLTLANRTPEGRRDAMAHLGSYLFHELTTPLGLRLDACRRRRHNTEGTAFRSLGTYSVWFPRGLMLRLAARATCLSLIQQWQAEGEPMDGEDFAPIYARAELDASSARVLADPGLDADALTNRLADLAGEEMGGGPSDLLTRLLSGLEEQAQQAVAHDDPGAWARAAMTRVREWLGGGVQPQGGALIAARKSKLTRALESAAGRLSAEWALRLAESAHALMEHPGRRVAIAEAMFSRLLRFTDDAAKAHAARLEKQAIRTKKAQEQLQGALQACVAGGGFSWFGSRPKRQLRVFMDHLAAFSRQCLAEDCMTALQVFYGALHGQLGDGLRELSFCRQRLRHVQETLESSLEALGDDAEAADNAEVSPTPSPLLSTESYWESIRESATTRVILPAGEEDLERAAASFVTTLTPEQWLILDQTFQEQVLAMRGGLYQACSSTSDLVRHLIAPLLTQATACLGKHLPITDVATVELALTADEPEEMQARIRGDHANAAPLTTAAPLAATGPTRSSGRHRALREAEAAERHEHSFLLVPASETGKAYGEGAAEVVPNLHLVTVPGQADLMFCREQDALSADELERILRPCRGAYEEVAGAPTVSPHARFDIHDWTPLDP